jgi:hypothetical protein
MLIFHCQSGSALADWALIEDVYRAQNTSRVFARLLGCSIESSWKIVSCLKQGRNFYELGNADFQVTLLILLQFWCLNNLVVAARGRHFCLGACSGQELQSARGPLV